MEFDVFDLFDNQPQEDGASDVSADAAVDYGDVTELHDFFIDTADQDDPDFSDEDEFQEDQGDSNALCDDAEDAFPVQTDDDGHLFDGNQELDDGQTISGLQGEEANELQPDTGLQASWINDALEPVFKIFDDIYYFFKDSDDIVRPSDFSEDGMFDKKNNVIVEGNVAHDIQFTDQQTHGSCSLMAQEQFVNRYIGQSLPEDYLEWIAEKAGVYSPDIGTDYNGQTLVLEHFHIPHERITGDIGDLNSTLSDNKDVIIGVDAREFYGDASIPPGSGHAVAIVGKGFNPETHELEGYYITDSNYPQSAHYVTVERLDGSWYGDMIAIPDKMIA